VSRESSFLFNNLVLLTACFVILWGTLFPISVEYVVATRSRWARRFITAWPCRSGSFCCF
jgi:cytochrome c-type biogenesis protein CcmF